MGKKLKLEDLLVKSFTISNNKRILGGALETESCNQTDVCDTELDCDTDTDCLGKAIIIVSGAQTCNSEGLRTHCDSALC